jgi:RNA polymerase sigma-70 factor (ECF subfamily)
LAISSGIYRQRPGILSVLLVGALALPVASVSLTDGGGVLKNSGFEDGVDSPDGWNKGAAIDGVAYIYETGVSHSGKHSISIKKDAQRFYPIAQWSQTFDYDGKSPAVQFTGWIKTTNVAKGTLDVQFLGPDGAVLGHRWVAYIGAKNTGDAPATFDWKEVGGVAKIPEGTKRITVALQDYGPGQVWLDDVTAKFVTAAETDSLGG